MRLPNTLAIALLVPLAAACAAGGGDFTGTGAGGGSSSSSSGGRLGGSTSSSASGFASSGWSSGSSTSTSSGGTSSGGTSSGGTSSGGTSSSGGCGLQATDPSCDTCLNASCCQAASDCANDSGCTICLGTSTPPASCDTDAALAALAGCLQTNCNAECFGGSSSSSGGTSSSGGALTCNDTNGGVGCCDGSGVLHYCDTSSSVVDQSCTGGTVCGWSAANSYYDCVSPPSSSDPSSTYPMACGGGSTSSSSGSTSSSSSGSSTSSGGAVTWTQIYNGVFGPTGTSACSKNGSCHTNTQSGFKCGTSKSTCYTGFVNSGMVVTGSGAPNSPLVDPAQSPLCGSLGGSMPKGGTCVTSAEITQIKSWLAAGAPNN